MRENAFDGSFYPADREGIIDFIKKAVADAKPDAAAGNAFSYVVPHAGYAYSGKTAAFTYRALSSNRMMDRVDTIVVIGPNHTGRGSTISVSMQDWRTPLGVSVNDKELSEAISGHSELISIDEEAHGEEHSIEVQLPFLQTLLPKKRLSFICMGDQSIDSSLLLSKAILDAAKELDRSVVVLASSDFDHFESAEVSRNKDMRLIEAIKDIDCIRFNELVDSLNDTICGFGPITVAMFFAKNRGAKRGILLKYSNSGDQTGDYSNVVAYSAIAFV